MALRQPVVEARGASLDRALTAMSEQGEGNHAMTEVTKPPRVVGTFGASLMSVNGMIGAGIFALPALLYDKTGNFAPWMFLVFGLLFACPMLLGIELAKMFRSSGGVQLYVQAAFGPAAGFQVGWLLVLAQAAGRAATLHVLVSYLGVFFPALDDPVARLLAILALLVTLGGLTLSGMRRAVGGMLVGMVLKATPIVVLCIAAFAAGGVSTHVQLPTFGTFESVALLVYFAYSGAGNAAISAGEVRHPRRTLPRSILLSLAMIILFYMIVQWAYMAAGAPASGSGTPLAAAAGALMGPVGATVLTLAAVFSIASNSLCFFVSGPRVIFGMAERGLLPGMLAHVSPRFLTPDRAVVLFSLIVACLALSGTFAFLAEVTALGAQWITLVMIGAFVLLRLRRSKRYGACARAFWWSMVAISTAFSIYAAMQATARAYVLLGVLVLVGSVLGAFARRPKRGRRELSPVP